MLSEAHTAAASPHGNDSWLQSRCGLRFPGQSLTSWAAGQTAVDMAFPGSPQLACVCFPGRGEGGEPGETLLAALMGQAWV